MSYSPLSAELARFHALDLQAEAGRRRLANLARCCRPSYLVARFGELRDRLAHRTAADACCS